MTILKLVSLIELIQLATNSDFTVSDRAHMVLNGRVNAKPAQGGARPYTLALSEAL